MVTKAPPIDKSETASYNKFRVLFLGGELVEPMTKFRRRLLFYSLLLAFLLLALWLGALARGFTFNLKARTFQREGAIFLRIIPANAAIYLDGVVYQSPSGILRTQAFVTNLVPGPHEIMVIKDGYHRWEKTLTVKPLEVTEASTVRLFPRAPRIESRIMKLENESSVTTSTLHLLIKTEHDRRQLPDSASSTLASLEIRPLDIQNTLTHCPQSLCSLVPEKTVPVPSYLRSGFARQNLPDFVGKYQIPDTIRYRDLVTSPDGKKVLVRAKNELWVVWLIKERVNGIHQPGEAERIVVCEEEISDAIWLPSDSHHMIFATGKINPRTKGGQIAQSNQFREAASNQNAVAHGRGSEATEDSPPCGVGVKIAETDGRGARNTIHLFEAQNVRFFLDPATQKLLFTDRDNLSRLDL